MEVIKTKQVENIEESLAKPEGIELFNISHNFKPQKCSVEISLNIGVNSLTKEFIVLIGKEKEYMDYMRNFGEIIEQFGEKINCLTHEFAKNNLAEGKYEKPSFDNEVEDAFMNFLKVLLGGKK